jgi:hypothetical protein
VLAERWCRSGREVCVAGVDRRAQQSGPLGWTQGLCEPFLELRVVEQVGGAVDGTARYVVLDVWTRALSAR